jgi:dimethylaniline monooxygenase (N-oxide forming)
LVGREGTLPYLIMLCIRSFASRGGWRRQEFVLSNSVGRTLSTVAPGADGDITGARCRWQFMVPASPNKRILMGCVAYDPAVGQIWDGIKDYLTSSSGGNLPHFDYVLFTNYEAQVSALIDGQIDVAWNGPVAHVMAEDLAASQPDVALVESCGMRDVDRDFRSVALIKRDCLPSADNNDVSAYDAMKGQTIATGSTDSPQGHLVPVDWLVHTVGVKDATIIPHEVDMGKHGDTAIGEIEAMKALLDGSGGTSAALVSEMMYQRGINGAIDGINAEELRESVVQLRDSPPVFDHCCFDALVGDAPSSSLTTIESHRAKIGAFSDAVLSMDMKDPCQAPIMKLEGIQKQWMPPRVDPGGAVRTALNRKGLARAGDSNAFGTQMRAFSSSAAPHETVAVLGAGVSGLQSVRALRSKGFDVTAYDSNPQVGGLWRENYLSYGVQVPKQLYEFPDLEFTEVKTGDYPTGAEVQKYIERYVDHFKLGDSITLNTKIKKVTQNDDGSWTVKIVKDGKEEDNHFDKVVIATGLYSSDNPSLPEWATGETASSFKGKILHSSKVQKAEQIAGKKVIVVGNGKSAVDLAVASANAGANGVTLLSRNAHWPTPRKIADLIPFQYVFLSRLGQNLVLGLTGPLPGCSPSHSSVWHSVGKFIMPPIFKVVELLFAAQFRNLTGPTSPFLKVGVVEDFYGYAQVLDYSLRDKVKAGEVNWKVGAIDSLQSDGAVLKDGEKVEADTIICGTGFQKDYSIFDDATQEKLNVEADGLWLYNHTIPTNVDNLAFVGSELAVISNISGYGLQAGWLSKFWTGEINANKDDMESEIKDTKAWKRKWMPATPSRSSLVLLHQIHFYDRLLRDMGHKVGRKSNILSEWFMPYESRDFDGVLSALEAKK